MEWYQAHNSLRAPCNPYCQTLTDQRFQRQASVLALRGMPFATYRAKMKLETESKQPGSRIKLHILIPLIYVIILIAGLIIQTIK